MALKILNVKPWFLSGPEQKKICHMHCKEIDILRSTQKPEMSVKCSLSSIHSLSEIVKTFNTWFPLDRSGIAIVTGSQNRAIQARFSSLHEGS